MGIQLITSKDILEATGLKSAKTLTRWYQRGLIPRPLIRTHPSGRGKIAYWPDLVIDLCVRIVSMQREGLSLESVKRRLDDEQFGTSLASLKAKSASELLQNQTY